MAEGTSEELHRRREIYAATLLGLATIGSSTTAYLSTWWGSLEALRYGQASAARSESIRASNVASTQTQVDVSTYVAWLTAHAQGDTDLAGYLESRFRDELRPAFEAWRAQPQVVEEGGRVTPPGTPFAMPEYRLASQREAEQLAQRAESFFEEASRANTIGTNYALPTVLFATVLFAAGIATKQRTRSVGRAILVLATVVLALSTVSIFFIPFLP